MQQLLPYLCAPFLNQPTMLIAYNMEYIGICCCSISLFPATYMTITNLDSCAMCMVLIRLLFDVCVHPQCTWDRLTRLYIKGVTEKTFG